MQRFNHHHQHSAQRGADGDADLERLSEIAVVVREEELDLAQQNFGDIFDRFHFSMNARR